jgi:hypothetical protein
MQDTIEASLETSERNGRSRATAQNSDVGDRESSGLWIRWCDNQKEDESCDSDREERLKARLED